MSKHVDQVELASIIANKKGVDQEVVVVLIQQLFSNIETKLKTNSSIKVDGLGTFRVIQSGATKRILFLDNVSKPNTKASIPLSTTQPTIQVENPSISRSKPSISGASTGGKNKTSVDLTKASETSVQQNTLSEPSTQPTLTEDKPNISTPIAETSTPSVSTNNNHVEAPAPTTERDAFARQTNNRNVSNNNFQSNTVAPKKNSLYIVLGIIAAFIIVGAVVYTLLKLSSNRDSNINSNNTEVININTDDNGSATRMSRFAEVANNDPKNISCVILVDIDTPVKDIARLYYGKELFWPYIFEANRNVVDTKLTIQMNTLVKVPRLTIDLVDYSTGILDKKVQNMGDKILEDLEKAQQ